MVISSCTEIFVRRDSLIHLETRKQAFKYSNQNKFFKELVLINECDYSILTPKSSVFFSNVEI